MKLLSVNVSLPKELPYRGEMLRTGIYKEPVAGRVMLRQLNLDGDSQADLSVHGGEHMAAYVYPHEHYPYWAQKLQREDFAYGQFGENFTVEGLLEDEVCIGDAYRIGQALVEVTQPRAPCFKLEHKMGVHGFIKTFQESRRTGFYLRVLEPGEVGAGDRIQLEKRAPESMSVREVFHLLYFDPSDVARLERAQNLPGLSPTWRGAFGHVIEQAQ